MSIYIHFFIYIFMLHCKCRMVKDCVVPTWHTGEIQLVLGTAASHRDSAEIVHFGFKLVETRSLNTISK